MYSFPYLEPVCCSVSNSNCFFLTCIQISQEAAQVIWYTICKLHRRIWKAGEPPASVCSLTVVGSTWPNFSGQSWPRDGHSCAIASSLHLDLSTGCVRHPWLQQRRQPDSFILHYLVSKKLGRVNVSSEGVCILTHPVRKYLFILEE